MEMHEIVSLFRLKHDVESGRKKIFGRYIMVGGVKKAHLEVYELERYFSTSTSPLSEEIGQRLLDANVPGQVLPNNSNPVYVFNFDGTVVYVNYRDHNWADVGFVNHSKTKRSSVKRKMEEMLK